MRWGEDDGNVLLSLTPVRALLELRSRSASLATSRGLFPSKLDMFALSMFRTSRSRQE